MSLLSPIERGPCCTTTPSSGLFHILYGKEHEKKSSPFMLFLHSLELLVVEPKEMDGNNKLRHGKLIDM